MQSFQEASFIKCCNHLSVLCL